MALKLLEVENQEAVSIAFLTLAFAQLWHAFNMRDPQSRFLSNEITRNPYIWGSIGLCSLLLVIAVFLPGLSSVLKILPPGKEGWLLIAVMSLVPLILGQAWLTVEKLLGMRAGGRKPLRD